MSKINNTFALLDRDFLKKLDEYRNKEIYVKLVSLNWDENPIAEIQGNVQSGSINIDGSSSVRRTCNLTLVTNTIQIDEVAWSLRTKFYVYLGVKNDIDNKYEDIIWFPQGMYVITSFNASLNGQGYQISISGKDKMCLINGDVGGALFAAHEFSIIYTTHADGTITKDYIPVYEIIKEALHTYAQEPYKNIVINDLNSCGVELLDYIGTDINMYIYNQRDGDDGVETAQIDFGTQNNLLASCFDDWIEQHGGTSYNLPPFSSAQYSQLTPGVYYTLLKRIQPTDVSTTAGYRATDITYTGELTVAVGGTITEMLDKIVKMLGEFEYFYDINGRFIFQRKRIYFNSTWTNAVIDEDQTYYDGAAMSTSSTYDFTSGYLIESFQNKPQLNAIKNDFSIWGKITGVNNTKLPIHLRYAIDHKPRIYYSLLEGKAYYSNLMNNVLLPNGEKATVGQYDWRELIYQMARDNLAAQSKIYGLQASLSTLNSLRQAELNYAANPSATNQTLLTDWQNHAMYHYDYQRLDSVYYAQYYRYDLTKKKFKLLTSRGEFESCKQAGDFLYGPDRSKRKLQLSAAQIEEMNTALGYDYMLAAGYVITANRNYELENEMLDQFAAENYLTIAQSELDAWQDTFNTGYDAYYADMLAFWPQLYRTSQTVKVIYNDDGTVNTDSSGNLEQTDDTVENYAEWVANGYWNPDYVSWDSKTDTISFIEPESLFFWLDFCDQDGTNPELYQYAVDVIGRRAKAVNDESVKCIYIRETPGILFTSSEWVSVAGEENLGYTRIAVAPPVSDYFRISSQGKSAKEELDSMLYNATYFNEQVSFSSIPIYYLEPNTRITVRDEQSGIQGEYLIKSLSLQLQHDGMMSVTATRAVDRII